MMIEYKLYGDALANIEIADGFFENWPKQPDKQKHREILGNSYKAIVAVDGNQIIGFVNVISDGVLSAYIPLLEVIPKYRNRGIGQKLIQMAIAEMKDIYMLDLSCDDDLVDFYKRFDMVKTNAMSLRNYSAQAGLNGLD